MAKHPHYDRVSDTTQKLLLEKRVHLVEMKKKEFFYKRTAYINLDYDLLENQYVVRKYFQKKHDINLRDLEILLYLYPKGYFSRADYKAYPLHFSNLRIQVMIRKGHIQVFQEGENMDKHVYSLTQSTKHKVQTYYKLLTGELQIPVIGENNPMIRKDATPHEQKIIKMYKRLAQQRKEKKGE